VGTLDGANVEIVEEVGADNAFLFGLKAAEVQRMRQTGAYQPRELYDRESRVKRVTDVFLSNVFCAAEPDLFAWIFHTLLDPNDVHFHLADLPAYLDAHARVAEAFLDRRRWARMSMLNFARIGKFSSDRTVAEYAREIWEIEPVAPIRFTSTTAWSR
jgi:starch phosphorylase